nr:venom polypeptide precursor [Doratifera vulnerans]
MFSPRILTVFALVAAATAWPASEKPQYPDPFTQLGSSDFFERDDRWYSFFDRLFGPVFSYFPKFTELTQSGPKITEDDNKFQVIMKLDKFNKEDIKVKVKGCFLNIQGTHDSKKGDHEIFSSNFIQTYSLPANSSGKDVTAQFTSDNTLIVTAPKNGPADNEDVDRQVPIEETGKPYVPESKDKPENKPSLEISTLPEDDRKEPTTPGTDFNNSADNDNSIPHGSDAKP